MESPENSSPQNNNSDPEKPIEKTRKKKSKNPSRFCDDQIKSLESIFMLENKLEARKKLEIAKDLGLQPRQVAIWFQNRRARWKSKQLEQDYNLLKANYDDLYVRFRDLKNENQCLQMQLQEFNGVVKNLDSKEYNLTDGDAELKEEEENPNSSSSNEGMEMMMMMNKYLEISRGEEEMSQLTSPEKWCGFSSGGGGLFDQLSECSNWWES